MKKVFISLLALFALTFADSPTEALQRVEKSLQLMGATKATDVILNKFGRNQAVGTSSEVIWDGGNGYVWQDSAQILKFVSSDANDSLGGAGANEIVVFGLDSNYNEIQDTLNLSGTDTVATTNKYLRAFRSFVYSVGDSSSNIGDITGVYADAGDVAMKILSGNGQTLMCLYTVPAGKTFYINHGTISIGSGKAGTMEVKYRDNTSHNPATRTFYTLEIYQNTTQIIFNPMVPLPEKTDFWAEAYSQTGTVKISGAFQGFVRVND